MDEIPLSRSPGKVFILPRSPLPLLFLSQDVSSPAGHRQHFPARLVINSAPKFQFQAARGEAALITTCAPSFPFCTWNSTRFRAKTEGNQALLARDIS